MKGNYIPVYTKVVDASEAEYFATMTATYFYYNIEYPFVAADLYEYDYDTFGMIEQVWFSEEEENGRITTSSDVYVPLFNVPARWF